MGREECRCCQTAVDGPEELKPLDKTYSNTKAPDHAETCKTDDMCNMVRHIKL